MHVEQGEWSEVTNISTKDTQTFEIASNTPGNPFAQLHSKGKRKWISFDKLGTLHSTYGYSFGEHLWVLKI
jgi:hypothetical protein